MIRDTLLLLQIHYKTFAKGLTRARPMTLLLNFFVVLVGIGFAAASAGAGALAALMVRVAKGGSYEALPPGLLLTLAVVLLAFGGIASALNSMYLSSDLERLMVAPVNRRAVFIAKLLSGIESTYLLLLVVALPALVVYGVLLSFGVLYYLLCVVAILGAPLFGAALGALIAMLLARFAPAQRVREVIGAFASLIGLSCWLFFQFCNRLVPSTTIKEVPDPTQVTGLFDSLANLPIPTFWAGRGLVAAGHNDLVAGFSFLIIYLLLTFGLFAVTVLLADSLYATGWLRLQSSGVAHRKPQRAAQVRAPRRLPVELALALKDWRLRIRDLRLLVQLLANGVIGVVVFISMFGSSTRLADSAQPAASRTSGLLSGLGSGFNGAILAFGILFAGVMLLDNVALTGISMEGRAYWILKAAPLRAWQILLGKLLAAVLPFVVITTVLFAAAAVIRHMNPAWSIYGWIGIELLGSGTLTFHVAMSVPWAKLDWEDPAKMTAGTGGCLAWIGALIYGVPAGLLLCVPLAIAQSAPNQLALFAAGALVIAVLWTLVFAVGSTLYACRAWGRIGDT